MAKRILIVDDNAVNRKYARAVLGSEQWHISEVEDGESALEQLEEEHFDLVLMDIQMPGMDGFECLKHIQTNLPKVTCPILAVTAFSSDREREKFAQAGFMSLIPKPIKASDFKAEVARWLDTEQEADTSELKGISDGPLIDMALYEDLKRHIRSENIIDIYEEFETETSGFIEQLNFLVPAKNYPEILSILHTIKGNAGSLGIFFLADHTRQMEEKLREKRYQDLDQDFDLLKKGFGMYVEGYRKLLN